MTTPPNVVAPSAGNVPVTQRNNGLGSTENQQPSDFWKVAVGVVVGAVLVLLVILTLRFCFKNKTERSTRNNLDKTVPDEPIYEEMKAYKEQPRRRDSSISEAPSTSMPASNHSTKSKLIHQSIYKRGL